MKKQQTKKNKYKKTKRRIYKQAHKTVYKAFKNNRITRKEKYGGETNLELKEEQRQKNLFRRTLNNYIIQINNKKNTKQALKDLSKLFENSQQINTLIPVTESGKPIDKETYSLAKKPVKIYDFVSPVSVILDNLTNTLSNEDIIKLLNIYYKNGGNFNSLSSRFKESPLEHQIKKQNISNVKILLDKSNPFHIIEDGLSETTKIKLAELIPNEQIIQVNYKFKNKKKILNLNKKRELFYNYLIHYQKIMK